MAAAGDPDPFSRLRQIAEKCDATASSGQWPKYVEHDQEFHRMLISSSGNKRLMELIEVLTFQIETFPVYHQYPPRVIEALQSSARQRVREHQLLAEAIASGDPDRAEREIRQHIRGGLEIVLEATQRARLLGNREQGTGNGIFNDPRSARPPALACSH